MKYDEIKYLDLLRYSNRLKKQGKFLYDEDEQAYLELLQYQILIRDHVFWKKKQNFILLITDFLNKILNTEEFINEFFYIHNQIEAMHEAFKTDFEKLKNFEPDSRSIGFGDPIEEIFINSDNFEPDTKEDRNYNKELFKDSIKHSFLQIQKYL
jgi:hypothetical protein